MELSEQVSPGVQSRPVVGEQGTGVPVPSSPHLLGAP